MGNVFAEALDLSTVHVASADQATHNGEDNSDRHVAVARSRAMQWPRCETQCNDVYHPNQLPEILARSILISLAHRHGIGIRNELLFRQWYMLVLSE